MATIHDVKNYWNANPCNIRHSGEPVGTKKYFDESEVKKYFVEPHIPEFVGFNYWYGKKVLEIGCGIGADTIRFARAGAHVTAVDYSEKSLEIAKQRAELFQASLWKGSVKFFHANAEKLSQVVPIEKYDLIYSFGVIHHTPLPEMAILEIKKYMGPQTILKIMVYHKISTKAISNIFQYAGKYSEARPDCPVTYTYTKKSAANLLCGFDIREMRIDHIFPYKIKEYKKHIYKKKWYWAWMPKPLFRFIEKRLGWHLLITCASM